MFVDGGRGVKVNKDGQGLTQVWREQLMQFKSVGAEIANAIVSHYPSPRTLMIVSQVYFHFHFCNIKTIFIIYFLLKILLFILLKYLFHLFIINLLTCLYYFKIKSFVSDFLFTQFSFIFYYTFFLLLQMYMQTDALTDITNPPR